MRYGVSEEVKRFPIGGFQRWHNVLGKRAVPCIVSHRWLQFPEMSDRFEDGDYPDGDYMFIDVMTTAAARGTPRRSFVHCAFRKQTSSPRWPKWTRTSNDTSASPSALITFSDRKKRAPFQGIDVCLRCRPARVAAQPSGAEYWRPYRPPGPSSGEEVVSHNLGVIQIMVPS